MVLNAPTIPDADNQHSLLSILYAVFYNAKTKQTLGKHLSIADYLNSLEQTIDT